MELGVDIVAALLLTDDIGEGVIISASADGSGGASHADWVTLLTKTGGFSFVTAELVVIKDGSYIIFRGAARFDTSSIATVASALLKFTPKLGVWGGTIIAGGNVHVSRPTITNYVFPAPTIYKEVRAGYTAFPWGLMSEIGGEYVYDFTANYASVAALDIGFAQSVNDVGGVEPSAVGIASLAIVDPYLELVASPNLGSPGMGANKGDWAIFKWQEPAKPLKCITLYGLDGDRLGRDPRPPRDLTIMPRVQIRVRSPEVVIAEAKLQYIEMILDATINKTVTLTPPVGAAYNVLVKHVQRSGNLMPIGRDDNGAFLWTMDVRIALGQIT